MKGFEDFFGKKSLIGFGDNAFQNLKIQPMQVTTKIFGRLKVGRIAVQKH
jgi:hypothetical protein